MNSLIWGSCDSSEGLWNRNYWHSVQTVNTSPPSNFASSWCFPSSSHIIVHQLFLICFLKMFVDNFQTAKEALSAATAQAAEKAASSVRGFAQKSFRLSMDIKLKAPLIIIPQSSTSHNAVLVDLGLIKVGNSFSLLQAEGFSLPAVVENMDVKLTQLKLSR